MRSDGEVKCGGDEEADIVTRGGFRATIKPSFNYSINPEMNKIKKAKFSMPGVIGLLDKYDIEVDSHFS